MNKTKTYIATFHFGYETDTLDSEGVIINEKNKNITREVLENILPEFIGKQLQMPPNFSAKNLSALILIFPLNSPLFLDYLPRIHFAASQYYPVE